MGLKTSISEAAQQRKWEVENAMNTLQRVEKTKRDKKLMGEVKKSALSLAKTVGVTAGRTSSKSAKRK